MTITGEGREASRRRPLAIGVLLPQFESIAFWENWSVLPALAEATSRARVGTLITCANYRTRPCWHRWPRRSMRSATDVSCSAWALAGPMIGSGCSGAARYGDEWNAWIPNRSRPAEVPPLREALDAACGAAGREPTSLRRSVGIAVGVGDATLRIGPVDWTPGAIRGSPQQIATTLRSFADEGISEAQIALAPFGTRGIEAFASVLTGLDAV